jgi:DNA polymerase I-like protein with 3'-5' exonuclease and polymerase domains
MSDRQQEWYLYHYTPPIDMGPQPVLLLTSPAGETRQIELSELAAFRHPLVTHSFTFLVDWFRRLSLDLPDNVIDIETAKKLLVGRPKSDFAGKVLPWDMSAIMLPYLPTEYDNIAVKRALSTHLAEPRAEDLGDFNWMLTASRALLDVWRDLVRDLSTTGESERFFSVEIPVYQVMLGTQLAGIRVDATKRDTFLSEVESQYITAHHFLAVKHNVHVDRALHDASYLATCLNLPDIQDMDPKNIIGSLKDSEPVCSKLHDIDSARRNKTIMLRTFSLDQEFCYPVFDTMGTVTGRILVVDPHLQYLKKVYRSVLVPRPDTNHIYIDYSQFEPNIMANMSSDPALLDLCGTNDLYDGLAVRLFGSRAFRKQTKTLFLAYSYGMGRKGLEALVSKTTGADSNSAASLLDERFYGLFVGIQRWKESLHEQLFATGRIGTAFGNFRNRIRKGRLNVREERWSVSQVVQGTGSLILKRLICKISTLFPEVQMLLPMHDALLIEIPVSGTKQIREKIVAEFIAAFSETCPGLEPRVTVGPFAPQEDNPVG